MYSKCKNARKSRCDATAFGIKSVTYYPPDVLAIYSETGEDVRDSREHHPQKGKPCVGFLYVGFDYVGKAHANNNRRNNKR